MDNLSNEFCSSLFTAAYTPQERLILFNARQTVTFFEHCGDYVQKRFGLF